MTLEEDFPRYDGLDDEDEQTEVLRGLDLGAAFAQRYRLEGVIGQGAMGKVFRATDMSLGQSVALKVLHTEKATKPEVVERFRREATVLSELGHPGIVRILDRGNNGEGIDYLVMELIEGTSLQDYVRKRGPLSPEELLPLLVTVCDAVGAAHAKGIIHRDLKPDNLLVYHAEGEARAKVVDFGLSRLRQDASERLTATGTMIGTPRYMAPEQIRSSKDADERTDIYACGVLAFEALTGQSPFPAEDAGQLLGCVIENRVLRLDEVKAGAPTALANVLRQAMAKAPQDRFPSTAAFVEAFAVAIGRPTGRTWSQRPASEISAPPTTREHPRSNTPDPGSGGDVARFTMPPPQPASVPAPTDRKRRSRAAITVGIFFLALVFVSCLATGGALLLRRVMAGGEPTVTDSVSTQE